MSKKHTPRRGRSGRRSDTFSRFFVTVIIVFISGYFDILGIHGSLEPLAERISQRVLAPGHYATSGQNLVTVVLIDHDYMERQDGRNPGWPLPATDFLRNILDPIVHSKPAAVFIDVSFTDMPRPVAVGRAPDAVAGISALAGGIKERSAKVPIFVSDLLAVTPGASVRCDADWINRNSITKGNTLSSHFLATAFDGNNTGDLRVVPPNWLGDTTEYPIGTMLAAAPGACQSTHDDVVDYAAGGNSSVPQGGFLLSPAAAIAAVLCDRRSMPADSGWICSHMRTVVPSGRNGGYGLYALDSKLERRLLVQWGTRQSETAKRYFGQAIGSDQCKQQNRSSVLIEGFRQTLLAWMPSMDGVIMTSTRPCPYIDTVSAEMVRDPEHFRLPPGTTAADFYRAFFANRVVMIGTDLPYVKDTVVSPVAGEVPGVYLHAIALENLTSSHGKYASRPDALGRAGINFAEGVAVGFLAWLMSLAFHWLTQRRWMAHLLAHSHPMRIVVFFVALTLVSMIVLSGAIFLTILTDWLAGFANVGDVVFVALAVFVALTDQLQNAIFDKAVEREGLNGRSSG